MPIAGSNRLLIAHADGPDGPATARAQIARLLTVDDFDLLMGWVTRPHAWLADGSETGTTVMATAAMARPVDEGRGCRLQQSLVLRAPELILRHLGGSAAEQPTFPRER